MCERGKVIAQMVADMRNELGYGYGVPFALRNRQAAQVTSYMDDKEYLMSLTPDQRDAVLQIRREIES